MKRVAILVALALGASVAHGQEASDAPVRSLVVVIRGLRSDRGTIRGAVFDRAARWTREGGERAICRVGVAHGEARCAFGDLAPGRYAFAFFHDEDGDGSLDRDWIGMPSEAFGFSSARAGLGGAPSFRDASFVHDGRAIVVDAQHGI